MLLNAALQPPLFYDMRVGFLEDQAAEVIKNRGEIHGDFAKAVTALKESPQYTVVFQNALGSAALSEYEIKNALASYLRSLVTLDTPFDRYMRGERQALTSRQVAGLQSFYGQGEVRQLPFRAAFQRRQPA